LVRTDIAGFVGYAERGPLPEDFEPGFDATMVAKRLTSWAEYTATFGSFLANGFLPFAVRGFFETGGDTCYVVRVAATRAAADRQPVAASLPLPAGPAQPAGILAGSGGGASMRITLAAALTTQQLVGAGIAVQHTGLTQNATILASLADGSFLLSAPLDARFAVGDAVTWFPAAATIAARTRGAWGNRIRLDFVALDAGAFGLTVTVDLGPGTPPTEQEVYRRLTPAIAAVVLAEQSNLVVLRSMGPPRAISFDPAGPLAGRTVYLGGGRDGLSDVTMSDFTGTGTGDRRGLRLLEEIDDIGVIAVPDTVLTIAPPLKPPPVVLPPCTLPPEPSPPPLPPDPTATPPVLSDADQASLRLAMIGQAQRLNVRVALIDPPGGLQPDAMLAWADLRNTIGPASRFAALYYPWLLVQDPRSVTGSLCAVPPSGHVAGAYATNDLTHGVQHPPANIALPSVRDLESPLTSLQQGLLNVASINVIRSFPGRGVLVWGARSLAADGDTDWRFIHVRRLISAIEETVRRSSRWAVFEVNDATLRSTLTHALTVLLEGIWATGGLQGATPTEGFYVKCDTTNNLQPVIDAGQVVCQIGVAVAAPMEFIVFEIRQDVAGGALQES
jgi:hypothetical protein